MYCTIILLNSNNTSNHTIHPVIPREFSQAITSNIPLCRAALKGVRPIRSTSWSMSRLIIWWMITHQFVSSQIMAGHGIPTNPTQRCDHWHRISGTEMIHTDLADHQNQRVRHSYTQSIKQIKTKQNKCLSTCLCQFRYWTTPVHKPIQHTNLAKSTS